MPVTLTALLIAACLSVAILSGGRLRRWLPEPHLTGDTKDTVKVALGLIATMSALLLDYVVGARKGSCDSTVRVSQITKK